MYTFRIFNPEHEIALACNRMHFTAPKAGRGLRADVGFLPVFWAKEGDRIIVDDVERSRRTLDAFLVQHDWWLHDVCQCAAAGTLTADRLPASAQQPEAVDPWGWDLSVWHRLLQMGVSSSVMPAEASLQRIRELAHRRTAARLLRMLSIPGTTGVAQECRTIDEVETLLCHYGHLVVKAPWSSSGRGVRFLSALRPLSPQQRGWIAHILEQQESIMAEPYYNKVKDMAMEFMVLPDGKAVYDGLSLFHTVQTAYVGNVLASEEVKWRMISGFVSEALLQDIQERICSCLPKILDGGYQGPLGIDMMVVRDEQGKMLLHPCVEMNLRRTMGHVALSLSPRHGERTALMQIVYDKHYELKIINQQTELQK